MLVMVPAPAGQHPSANPAAPPWQRGQHRPRHERGRPRNKTRTSNRMGAQAREGSFANWPGSCNLGQPTCALGCRSARSWDGVQGDRRGYRSGLSACCRPAGVAPLSTAPSRQGVTAGLRATDRSLCVTETRDPLVARSPVWRSRPALVAGTPAQARTSAVVSVQAEHVLQELGGEFAVSLPGECRAAWLAAGFRWPVLKGSPKEPGTGQQAVTSCSSFIGKSSGGDGLETDLVRRVSGAAAGTYGVPGT